MKSWKRLVQQHDALRAEMGAARQNLAGLTFDRVQLLCRVFDDAAFREDNRLLDDAQAADFLDAFVSDLGQTFLALRSVYQARPQRSAWESASVFELCIDVLEETRSGQAEHAVPQRKRVKLADYEAAVSELSQQRGANKSLQATLADLRAENAELRRELAVSEGRIRELERLVSREGVTA